ncbi:MAG: 6-carboxytetrahydropterin synthase [Saprospiraceae bacterium]
MRIAAFRRSHFNAAHRLNNPTWSVEKNKEVFGLCNNDNYHGHNYEYEVKVVGEVDKENRLSHRFGHPQADHARRGGAAVRS